MITLRKNIPSNFEVDLPFIESVNNKNDSYPEIKNPNEKQQPLKKAQWNPESGKIEGIDE